MRSGRPTRSNLRRCKTWIGRTMYRRTDQQSRMGMFRCPGAGSSQMWAFASDGRRLRRTMLRLGIVIHLKNHEGGKLCNRLMTPLFFFCNPPLQLCNRKMTPLFFICSPPFCSLFSYSDAKAKHIETANCNCVTVHKRPQSKSSQCPRKGENTPNLSCHLSPEVKNISKKERQSDS